MDHRVGRHLLLVVILTSIATESKASMSNSAAQPWVLAITDVSRISFVGCGAVSAECLQLGWSNCTSVQSSLPDPEAKAFIRRNATNELLVSSPNRCYMLGQLNLCEALEARRQDECALVIDSMAANAATKSTASIDYNDGCIEIDVSDMTVNGVSLVASLRAASCRTCSAGFTSGQGMQACTPCADGSVSNGSTACTPCIAGNVANSNQSACTPLCSNQTVFNSTSSSCISCPNGTHPNSAGTICVYPGNGGRVIQKITPARVVSGDSFGMTIAASGNTFIVGIPGFGRSGSVAVFNFDGVGFPESWNQLLLYPEDHAYSGFGNGVAIEGDLMVIGTPYFDIVVDNSSIFSIGIVYVYTRPTPTSNFTMSQNLTSPSYKGGDRFGTSIAIFNGVIYVSAPGFETDSTVIDHGGVWIFIKDTNGVYIQTDSLVDVTKGASDRAGTYQISLAVIDGIVAVGAAMAEVVENISDHGAVMVYERAPNGNWSQTQKLTGSQVGIRDFFGTGVSLATLADGSTIMASGAHNDDGISSNMTISGAVYVFEKKPEAASFTETQIIRAPDAQALDYFGRQVVFSSDGMTLMVSAEGVDDLSSTPTRLDVGAAYTYTRNASGYFVQTGNRLQRPLDVSAGRYFGRGIAMTDHFTLIGDRDGRTVYAYYLDGP
eukprot:m.16676 g.16676  ORF g.16676 m.16676 type:complete len:663 (+) comp10600_c0_seq4:132-2120(+)